MTTDELATRLIDLRTAMTSVLGFHEVIDAGDAKTPLDARSVFHRRQRRACP